LAEKYKDFLAQVQKDKADLITLTELVDLKKMNAQIKTAFENCTAYQKKNLKGYRLKKEKKKKQEQR